MTAAVTGQVAAGQRQRAREAQQRQREAVVLYDVVRLVGEQDLEAALRAGAERLREELGVEGVAIEIAQADGGVVRVAAGKDEALRAFQAGTLSAAHVLNAGRGQSRHQRATPGRWVRLVPTAPRGSISTAPVPRDRVHLVPVRADDRRVGALLLAAARGSSQCDQAAERLLSPVPDQ